ncbi:uncharacterized protein BDZ99DRAFT_463226 [Mytilinidion resinicola]|uniref:Uncharacterized protein n=1 Tax=Mytilinidion resinicola TaxID=574789 RepID=A0A6A6YKM5_9PEZI|nr:uncharacterized protein BDZ99DRAFT_463226 [Mytilinidion resinicola]KAF2809416.1 hypothetical protein BDZ99DRAFT_463226 [Mytilinidion resinicola]
MIPWYPLYPKEEIALICANCRKLEQLGLPLFGEYGAPEYIGEFTRLPNLHTLRITSGHNDKWKERKKRFARSCLTSLVRKGSNIQISALVPMGTRSYHKDDFAVWRLQDKQVLTDGRIGWVEVDKIEIENLGEHKTDILTGGEAGQY